MLVVDDERPIRELICDLLSADGYAATPAGGVDEALAALERRVPALVLTDLTMPGRSGVDLLDAVRERQPHLPVLLLSGADGTGELAAVLRRGAAGFLAKPFTATELLDAVSAAIAGGRP